jgi:hypothetical protein
MFENFQKTRSFYYVVVHQNRVLGPQELLYKEFYKGHRELQKMYFSPTIEGKGLRDKGHYSCNIWMIKKL